MGRFIGEGSMPSGGIIMWSGSTASIPAGWYLCNGANGTPDLRNRFVVGAGSSYGVNATGGYKDAVAISHSHSGSTNTTGDHYHLTGVGDNPGYNQIYGETYYGSTSYNRASTRGSGVQPHSNTTGNHSHTVSVNFSGVSGTNRNMPPYLALAYIMKS